MFVLAFVLLLASAPFHAAYGQSQPEHINKLDGSRLSIIDLDRLVSDAMAEARVTGLQLAVFNGAQPAYVRSYGYRDALQAILLDNDTVLGAASLSKSMFACIVLKLVEDGRFDLDTPVGDYLDFPLYELENFRFDCADLEQDARRTAITGRMPLTHTAGFRNYRFFGDDDDTLLIHFDPSTQYPVPLLWRRHPAAAVDC